MLRRLATLTAVVSAALTVVPAATSAPPDPDPTVVRTDAGYVRGVADEDVVRFSGVPYAAPPTGDRRWTAPRPPRPWPGVRDATAPAASCPQAGYDEEFDPIVEGDEDCLYVDVVAPARARHDGRLPVVVWLHGGNLASGGAAEFDGARLAGGGDVVVVTVNYRLGALGFLSAGALDAEGTTSGNYGLLDQAEALRWVRRNAAAFGGDPRRVTLAGQSAGARSVCTHLASPGSRRLFQQAIVQSGACANPVMKKADADHKGAEAIRTLGCADAGGARDVAECLRAAPVSDLVLELAGSGPPVTAERREDLWGPVAGTPYLPLQPIDAIRRGSAAGIPLLVGSTHDEMRGIVLGRHAGPDGGGIRDRGPHRVRSRRSKGAEEVSRRRLRHSSAWRWRRCSPTGVAGSVAARCSRRHGPRPDTRPSSPTSSWRTRSSSRVRCRTAPITAGTCRSSGTPRSRSASTPTSRT